jgi:glutamine amidotransferase
MIAVLDYGIGNLRSAEKALQHVGADAHLVTDPELAAGADGVVLPGVGAFGACARELRRSGLDEVVREAVRRRVPLLGICIGFQLLFEGSEEDPSADGLGLLAGRVRRLPATERLPQMQWNVVRQVQGRPSLLLGLQELHDHRRSSSRSDEASAGKVSGGEAAGGDVLDGGDSAGELPAGGDSAGELPAGGASAGELPGDGASWFYFVHSYAPAPEGESEQAVVGVCDYGGPIVAAMESGSLFATQFHPEKSGRNGLELLRRFASVCTAETRPT